MGVGSALAAVEHNQIQRTRQASQGSDDFVRGGFVRLPELVFEQQPSLPSVTAEVQHVGEELLGLSARREGEVCLG